MSKIHRIAQKAVKDGVLVAPDSCEDCAIKTDDLVKHHEDYDKPLAVNWLCRPCHRKRHLDSPELKDPNPRKSKNVYVSDETKELIDEVSKVDSRTLDGAIKHLCKERIGPTRLAEMSAVRTAKEIKNE